MGIRSRVGVACLAPVPRPLGEVCCRAGAEVKRNPGALSRASLDSVSTAFSLTECVALSKLISVCLFPHFVYQG